jgi:hypothetical protein
MTFCCGCRAAVAVDVEEPVGQLSGELEERVRWAARAAAGAVELAVDTRGRR